ncbi:uncharacterized protein [Lolium perenne]|uniref:uncharacterized protein n=1 Tax=Lolium perenne TaxID=4522 RepID=UPI0021F5DFAD|nr:uncharacterized protein LOC127310206 [Lolium perenne]
MNALNKVLAKAAELELSAVRGILELFGQASGLRTNFAKCSVSPIACSDEEAVAAAEHMECQLAPFPVKYLGIPLSTRRLSAQVFQQLLDMLVDKLPTWRASMMPQAVRLALNRAVLAATPLHQLMVLALDRKTLKQINKILRGFLWVGRADANGGQCHVNWARVCRPLSLGGLGIPDLAQMAISLRVRWLWTMYTDPMRPWRGLDMQFSKAEMDIFAASTSMAVGNGESALFLEDCWLDGKSIKEMAPEVFALVPKRRGKVLDRCSFSWTVWFEVLSWIRSTSGPPSSEEDFAEWWSQVVRTAPRQLRKGTSSIIMLTAWWIWKHRNAAIFDNAQHSVPSLLNDIRTEAQQWADAGGRDVRQILP